MTRVFRAFFLMNFLCACAPQPAATQASPATRSPRASAASEAPRPSAATSAAASAALAAAPSVAGRAPSAAPSGDVERLAAGATAGARLPLLIALHGLGDTPENFAPLFDGLRTPARVLVLRAPTRFGDGWSWFAARATASEDAWRAGMDAAATALLERVRALAADPRTCGAPVLTGFSQGGMLTFALAARDAPLTRALPVGGMLPAALYPRARPRVPVEAFHGGADTRVLFHDAHDTVGAFLRLGANAVLHPYPDVEHTIDPTERADLLASIDRALREACH